MTPLARKQRPPVLTSHNNLFGLAKYNQAQLSTVSLGQYLTFLRANYHIPRAITIPKFYIAVMIPLETVDKKII